MRKKRDLKGTKVLLVDDDTFLSEILQSAFSENGAALYCAEHVRDALSIAREKMPDIILTDLMLSGVSGEEFIEILKADEQLKYIPVVVFTNKGAEHDVKANLARGAAEYHIKSETKLSDIPSIIQRVIKASQKPSK